ncbi:hypothetical protein [Arsenicicoccus sp. oral taxon 190]|uniref:hypothetical protein n=1 Tax=Arsenicicoccus sp. oral taxon 190 TaxID=1658671 RepID=UPI00067A094C|nr:hypothetical protein [Arsenicicoccus sp. oral taxon 190]AKT51551.1 hypothetical protein ADJ73_09985 [Arsenicicoccus sp. oral taxon 190]
MTTTPGSPPSRGWPTGSGEGDATGQGDPSWQRVAGPVRDFLERASSVRAVGTLNQGGTPMTFDLAGALYGLNARGKVSVGSSEVFDLVRVDGRSYVRSPGATGSARGRYVRLSDATSDQLGALDLAQIVGTVHRVVASSRGGGIRPVTYEGQEATELTSGSARLVVAGDGSGRLLQLDASAGQDTGTIAFSQWSEVPPVVPPPTDQIAAVPGA